MRTGSKHKIPESFAPDKCKNKCIGVIKYVFFSCNKLIEVFCYK